jgi:hypothetical protein
MRVAALLAVVVAAWAAGAARATTFHVENEHGVPLYAWATVSEIGLTTSTNEAGEVEPASEPGDTVTITRSDVTGPCGAPEGTVGPSYTVPDPEPDFVAIVLPALAMPSTEPALSPEERGLLGRLNEQRAMAGAGSFELRGGVRRPGRWRLVVRFDGTAGWRDAALKARTLGFTAPRARTDRRRA